MRYTPLVAAAGLLASGLAFGPQAQAAAPAPADSTAARTCTIYPPRSVAIGSNERTIYVRIGSDCEVAPRKIYARWDLSNPNHPSNVYHRITYGEGVTVMPWKILDEEEPLGFTTWRPYEASDANGGEFVQNQPTTLIKVASWAGITATRSGSRVTLTGAAARYSANANRMIAWTRAYGQLQYKARGTTTWRALAGGYTNSVGRLSVTTTSSTARDYRFVVPQTAQIWTAVSPTATR
jgi:hypothetical protein